MKFMAKSEDTRNFLKLKEDGDSAKGVFRGDIHYFKKHWVQGKSSVCKGSENNCQICASGDKPKFGFRINFVVMEGDALVAKVIEQGWTFHETLRTLNDGDYVLEKYFMKITRQGKGLHTTYSIIPMPNGLVSTETEKKLAAVKLNDLNHLTDAENESPTIDDPINDVSRDDDIPF